MPTSPSAKRNTSGGRASGGKRSIAEPPPQRSSLIKPLMLLVVVAIIVVAIVALPASMIGRFLPASIAAEDFSGTLWHGSAGRLTQGARNLGAVEWHLHPAALLHFKVSADIHWVKVGFVADGSAEADSTTLRLTHVQGGGPVEDLADLGLGHAWHGNSSFNFSEVTVALGGGGGGGPKLLSAVGDVNVANVTSSMVADGADLGGYNLHLAPGAVGPDPGGIAADSGMTATLTDTGGPLELQATIHLEPGGHRGLLSGTIRERAGATPALHQELAGLAQLHPPDASGRIPVDLEFTL